MAAPLAPDELARYARQLALPEVGEAGQARLKAGRVLVVGAGGLGSPVALHLAGAGVGRIGLVDGDVVDVTNLHRQILYSARDVGRAKAEAAAERLRAVNPAIEVVAHAEAFAPANAARLVAGYDVVVDATDNFAARYLANDITVAQGKPLVHASVHRFEGQLAVFDARVGPCYRCAFPRPPPPELVPSCAEAGVLGVVPGLLGTLQASEALKLLLGIASPALGRLVLVDAARLELVTLALRKDARCVACGQGASGIDVAHTDYAAFCGTGARPALPSDAAVTPRALASALAAKERPFLLDVREAWETRIAALPGAVRIGADEVLARADEVPTDRDVVVFCRSGVRSARVVEALRARGHAQARHLEGGLLAWSAQVDPSVTRY